MWPAPRPPPDHLRWGQLPPAVGPTAPAAPSPRHNGSGRLSLSRSFHSSDEDLSLGARFAKRGKPQTPGTPALASESWGCKPRRLGKVASHAHRRGGNCLGVFLFPPDRMGARPQFASSADYSVFDSALIRNKKAISAKKTQNAERPFRALRVCEAGGRLYRMQDTKRLFALRGPQRTIFACWGGRISRPARCCGCQQRNRKRSAISRELRGIGPPGERYILFGRVADGSIGENFFWLDNCGVVPYNEQNLSAIQRGIDASLARRIPER